MVDQYKDEMERLKAIEAEYQITIRVLAILAEIVVRTNNGCIAISDEALLSPPEIQAWRDEEHKATVIAVNT